MTTKRVGGKFVPPTFRALRLKSRAQNIKHGRLSTLAVTGTSDERILENTPVLKRLYEFLARPIP